MALKDPNKAQVRRAQNEGKRLNFWSSFNAKPKPQHKFLVRFGDNGLFYSGGPKDKQGDGWLDIDFSKAGFSDLNAIPNLAWMVKSVTRPSMNIPMKDAMYEQDGEFIGYKPLSIDAVTWVPITIKLINVANHTFYPNETTLYHDLDLLFGVLIDHSGYRFDTTTSTAGISDVGLPPLPVTVSNKTAYTLRSTKLFDPFEIIDLANDYRNDINHNYIDDYGTPITSDSLAADESGVYPFGKWTMYQPYLMDVSFGQNDYSNDNQFIEYTLKIGYYWAQYTSYAGVEPAGAFPNAGTR